MSSRLLIHVYSLLTILTAYYMVQSMFPSLSPHPPLQLMLKMRLACNSTFGLYRISLYLPFCELETVFIFLFTALQAEQRYEERAYSSLYTSHKYYKLLQYLPTYLYEQYTYFIRNYTTPDCAYNTQKSRAITPLNSTYSQCLSITKHILPYYITLIIIFETIFKAIQALYEPILVMSMAKPTLIPDLQSYEYHQSLIKYITL